MTQAKESFDRYYKNNRERILKDQKKHYRKNKAKVSKQSKKLLEERKERVKLWKLGVWDV